MSTDTGDGEMKALERLAAREADENFEDIHAALSKRGSLRTTLSSSRNNAVPTDDGRNSIASNEEEENLKGDRSRDQRSSVSDRRSVRSTLRSSEHERERSRRSSREDGDARGSNYSLERRRRRSRQGRSSRNDSFDDGGRPTRSASAIEKLLEYNEGGNYSMTSNENNTAKRSSGNPLLIGLSKSRDSSTMERRSTHKRSSKSRERRRNRRSSSAAPTSEGNEDEPEDPRERLRRQRSSSQQRRKSYSGRDRSSERKNGVSRYPKGTKSLRATKSFQSELRQEQGKHEDDFERLWGNKDRITSDDLNRTNESRGSTCSAGSDNGRGVSMSPGQYSRRDVSGGKTGDGTPGKVKKTKLEKIHELQGQCDRYKIDLEAMTEERRKCLRELKESRGEAASLKKIVDVHEEQSTKLKLKLAEVEDELEATRTEQRTERSELSEAAKDLARVNIDYAKSLDVARAVREELDGLKAVLAEREEKVSALEKDLEASNENVRHLEADVLYADDQIGKLEAELKKLENEVTLYMEAADRDAVADPDGHSDGANLREAKNEAERRKCEEREKEIEERNRILEEKGRKLEEEIEEFERQKTEHLEEQESKEKEFEAKRARIEEERAREEENMKISDEDRLAKEEEVNQLLNQLKDENTALNGRLKSEQLDSKMKLQNKENSIASLQIEVARLTKEQKERDSAPDSSPSLLLEIETLKTEATKRSAEFEDVRMKKTELENEVEGLQNASIEATARLSNLETELSQQKNEIENQRRKTLEWQKKTGEWSEKAVTWKNRAEHWEKKAKESNNDNASMASDDAAQVDPQALFLAAAVEKKAVSAVNANGSWRLGRRIFGMSTDSDDEAQALITKLEGENLLRENEIKTLKSEMVKMQTNYKDKAYSMTQDYDKLKKEKEAIELQNANLLKELELARKLNRTISESAI